MGLMFTSYSCSTSQYLFFFFPHIFSHFSCDCFAYSFPPSFGAAALLDRMFDDSFRRLFAVFSAHKCYSYHRSLWSNAVLVLRAIGDCEASEEL